MRAWRAFLSVVYYIFGRLSKAYSARMFAWVQRNIRTTTTRHVGDWRDIAQSRCTTARACDGLRRVRQVRAVRVRRRPALTTLRCRTTRPATAPLTRYGRRSIYRIIYRRLWCWDATQREVARSCAVAATRRRWHSRLYSMHPTRNAWQSLACSPPGIAVSPPSEK